MNTITQIIRGIKVEPTSSGWLFFQRQGEAALASSDFTKASKHLCAALVFAEKMKKSDPRIVLTLDRLAECSTNAGDYPSAVKYLNRTIALKFKMLGPSSAASLSDYRKLADLYEKQGLWIEAAQVKTVVKGIEANTSRVEFRSTTKQGDSQVTSQSREQQSETLTPSNQFVVIDNAVPTPVKQKRLIVSLDALKRATCA